MNKIQIKNDKQKYFLNEVHFRETEAGELKTKMNKRV